MCANTLVVPSRAVAAIVPTPASATNFTDTKPEHITTFIQIVGLFSLAIGRLSVRGIKYTLIWYLLDGVPIGERVNSTGIIDIWCRHQIYLIDRFFSAGGQVENQEQRQDINDSPPAEAW